MQNKILDAYMHGLVSGILGFSGFISVLALITKEADTLFKMLWIACILIAAVYIIKAASTVDKSMDEYNDTKK